MMYNNKVKSDGPVSLRSVKGKMGRVRTICDEQSKILLPLIEDVTDEDSGEVTKTIAGWKIASGADLDYIGEVFLGITSGKKKDTAEEPVVESGA